jgi:hypothetical protein
MRSPHRFVILAILLLLTAATVTSAQVGGTPGPPTTLWNFLGIPQGIQKMQGAMRNRRGNRPNREPKPPLKAIADPANLESPDPAIKKAAEIKQAEDLKKQKIKAVKYLASIGCGCYDIDGEVTAAMVASMQDCTEDVRLETVKAIADAAAEGCCCKCGSVCCCNKDILTQLAIMAYERDDHGCYVEPSADVRQEAANAIEVCCPNDLAPVVIDEPEKIPPPAPPEPLPPETPGEEDLAPPETGGNASLEERDSSDRSDQSSVTLTLHYPASIRPQRMAKKTLARHRVEARVLQQQVRTVSRHNSHPTNLSARGTIVHVSPEHRLAHVHFANKSTQPPVGSRIRMYGSVKGRRTLIGELEIVESFAGSANVSGSAKCMAALSRGDEIRWTSRTGGLQRNESPTKARYLQ